MAKSFFAKRVPLVGTMAVLTLCVIFFWLPFAIRGARMAVEGMKNDVKDWLPSDFPETKELDWFRINFLGEQFVIVTWPGANVDDPQFKLLVRKLRVDIGEIPLEPAVPGSQDNAESQGDDQNPEEEAATTAMVDPRSEEVKKEDARAREIGDKYGLYVRNDLYENWSKQGEKWLHGDGDRWFYLLPSGELMQWAGGSHTANYLYRAIARNVLGDYSLDGVYVATLGSAPTVDDSGKTIPNRYYAEPQRVTARFFHNVTTGPEVLEQLIAENGPLWPRGSDYAGWTNEEKRVVAEELAYERLTGVLFGPQPPINFDWTAESLPETIGKKEMARLPEDWETQVNGYLAGLLRDEFDGDREQLLTAPHLIRMRHYRAMFREMGVEPPHPQSCILVTLSKVGRRDLSRVVGRALMGKPRGRLLDLATGECQIGPEQLKLGGPPIDNVAIDEEGSITLARLVVFSGIIGLSLAWLSFRSIKITMMIFFVGGVSAMASLGIVWWCGGTVDAILMTMPALVYVLGLSGAVHIVNYYRDAVEEQGVEGAPEAAIGHGWFPCTLAAFTTALGLLSLMASNIQPIKKFGLFSALGVMATVILLFTYLPAALQLWPGPYKKRKKGEAPASSVARVIEGFWQSVGAWVVANYGKVLTGAVALMAVVALGLPRIHTSIQLLKLFDGDAKIIRDYEWMETYLGRLVPMELVVRVDRSAMRSNGDDAADEPVVTRDDDQQTSGQQNATVQPLMQYDFLERMEMVARVKEAIEAEFGDDGRQILGTGMALTTFAPELPGPDGGGLLDARKTYNRRLEQSRPEFLASDYLREDKENADELLRLSLRLGALNNVDYGAFVNTLKMVVEPILDAYRVRTQVLGHLLEKENGLRGASILVLGAAPQEATARVAPTPVEETTMQEPAAGDINQTQLFVDTLDELFRNRGFRTGDSRSQQIAYYDPSLYPPEERATPEQLKEYLEQFQVVMMVDDDPDLDPGILSKQAGWWLDARDYRYLPLAEGSISAAERKIQGDSDATVTAIYTGVVPVVYKAQRTLLISLIDSIGLAFVLIMAVMMVLLRDWGQPFHLWRNSLNPAAGLLSMLPNIFPVVMIFGVMGHLGVLVDIGSMMTASVAMGVAVDDTIHFLNWFRMGMSQGLKRKQAIALAYRHCATAMTQTTAIGGLGLAVFGLSTFTPTQRFGVLMFTLLVAALIGDLIMLPALLASPLGKYFAPEPVDTPDAASPTEEAKGKALAADTVADEPTPEPTAKEK
ncbi:efflux RND transporter permease subunit [Lignipirellula cremea]|uniref:MMPL family protein n=1 Tax=Lignipirellula cremea TaxID=2528010 RepID=A0A518DQ68_9BACT|nr:MMPL family transporter [Lignipirellula cremea]QDU93967.1 MMPL family protein [Lignipirellula cremea]